MHISSNCRSRRPLVFHFITSLSLLGVACAPEAIGQGPPDPIRIKWWIIDLGVPCECAGYGCELSAIATSVNECGVVVGQTRKLHGIVPCNRQAFVWSLCDGMFGLPTREIQTLRSLCSPPLPTVTQSEAWHIGDSGEAVGAAISGAATLLGGFRWDLSTLAPSGAEPDCDLGTVDHEYVRIAQSTAFGVTSSAPVVIAGTDNPASPPRAAWMTSALGPASTVQLADLGFGAQARDVERLAGNVVRVVGSVADAFGNEFPCLWENPTSTTAPATLGTAAVGGGTGGWGTAHAVNPSGDVCGLAVSGSFGAPEHAHAWLMPSLAPIDLGALVTGQVPSRAMGLSPRGAGGATTIVGWTDDAGPLGLIWWTAGGPSPSFSSVTANDLVLRTPPAALPDCWGNAVPSALRLYSVNSRGWMAGEGQYPLGRTRAIILVPSPCQADIDGDNDVDAADLSALPAAWGACTALPCASDLTADGAVNAADVAELLNQWGRACTLDTLCGQEGCSQPAADRNDTHPAVQRATEALGFDQLPEFARWLTELPDEQARSASEHLFSILTQE